MRRDRSTDCFHLCRYGRNEDRLRLRYVIRCIRFSNRYRTGPVCGTLPLNYLNRYNVYRSYSQRRAGNWGIHAHADRPHQSENEDPLQSDHLATTTNSTEECLNTADHASGMPTILRSWVNHSLGLGRAILLLPVESPICSRLALHGLVVVSAIRPLDE